jgi:hypothetical protein
VFDQKFQETLSDALQTLQDALSLKRESQDAVNAITDKAGRANDREVIKAVMAFDWETFKSGNRVEVGKDVQSFAGRIGRIHQAARLRAAHRAQLDQPTLASL